MMETFKYDNLDRLDTVMFNNAVSIAYTMHDKVKSIQQGDDVLTIDYGYDRQRIGMTQQNDLLHTTSSKLYVGSCEFNHGEIRLERLTYLTGPMGVFAVYEELGSVTTATWSGSFTGTPKFDRGYTGHEHLCTFGLINMKFTLSERSAMLCLSTAERGELGEANGR